MSNTSSNLSTETLDKMATNQPLPLEPSAIPSDEGVMGWLTQLLVYNIFGLLVCFGNGVTVLAVWKSPRLNSTADFYITSLAVADFLVGITFLVTSLTGIREIGKVFRENRYVCLTYLNSIVIALTASLLTLVCLSFDRCVCVLNPLKYAARQKRRTDLVLITLVWIVSIAYAAIPYIKPGPFVTGSVCIATIQHPKWYISYCHPLVGTSCFLAVAICYVIIGRKHFTQARKWGKGNVIKPSKTHCSGHKEANYKGGSDGNSHGQVKTIWGADVSGHTDASQNGQGDKAGDIKGKVDLKEEDLQAESSILSSGDSESGNNSTDENETENATENTPDESGNPARNRRKTKCEVHGPRCNNVCQSPAEPTNDKSGVYQGNERQSVVVNRPLSKQNARLVKMTFVILVVFFFSWSPGNIIIIVSAYTPIDSSIQMMFLVLTFLNSGLNVVIYVTMNRRYREAVLAILCLCNLFRRRKKARTCG